MGVRNVGRNVAAQAKKKEEEKRKQQTQGYQRRNTNQNTATQKTAAVKTTAKTTAKSAGQKVTYYSNKNKNKGASGVARAAANAVAQKPKAQQAAKNTQGRATARLARQMGARAVSTNRDIPMFPQRARTINDIVNPLEQMRADAWAGPRYWGSRAVVPSKPLTDREKAGKIVEASKQALRNKQVARQDISPWDRKYQSSGRQTQIQDAKLRWEEAAQKGDREAMDKAHREAENLRLSYGYSGGASGNEYIRPTLTQDEYNSLNKTGEKALAQKKLQWAAAQVRGDTDAMERYHRQADEIRGAAGYQDRGRDINTARGVHETAEGRSTMYGATREQREKDAEGLKLATQAGFNLGVGGAGHWLEATDWTIANRNRDQNMEKWLRDADNYIQAESDLEYYDNYVQQFGEAPEGMNRNVLVMRLNDAIQARAQLERMQTDQHSAYYDPTVAERLGAPKAGPTVFEQMIHKGQEQQLASQEGLNAAEKWVNDLYISGIQNIPTTVAAFLPGAQGGALAKGVTAAARMFTLAGMGASAGGNRLVELQDEGIPFAEAYPHATVSGMIEMATEAISEVGLIALGEGRVGKVLGKAWAQPFLEGFEESAAYTGNWGYSKLQDLPGKEWSWQEWASQTAAGFAMGALHTGAGVMVNELRFGGTREVARTTAEIRQQYQDWQDRANRARDLLTDAQQWHDMIEQGAVSRAEGEQVLTEIGRQLLWQETPITREQIQRQNDMLDVEDMVLMGAMSETEGRDVQSQIFDDYRAQERQRQADRLWDAASQAQTAERGPGYARNMYDRAQSVLARNRAEQGQTNPFEDAVRTGQEAIRTAAEEMQRREAEASPNASQTSSQTAPNTETVQQQPTSQTGRRAAMLDRVASTFGESGAAGLRDIGGKMTAGQGAFVRNYTDVYNQVLGGRKESQITRPQGMTDGQYFAAVTAAQNDRQTGWDMDVLKAAGAAGRNKNAGVDWRDRYVRQMDRKTARTVDGLAKALGVRVVFAEEGTVLTSTGARANADIQGNVVTIEKNNPNPVRMLVGHELTHRMQDVSPENYQAFRDYVMSVPGSMDAMERMLARYQEAGAFRDDQNARSMAMDELAADFAGEMLENSEQLREFIRQNYEKRTVLEMIRDAFRNLRDKLPGRQKAQADEAVRLLEDAIKASSQLVKEMGKESNAAETRGQPSPSAADAAATSPRGGGKSNVDEIAERQLREQAERLRDARAEMDRRMSIGEESGFKVYDYIASYTDERIDTILKEYGGGGNYAQGFVTNINPRDFLKLTLSDSSLKKWVNGLDKGEFPEEFFPLDREKLRNNRQTPYLRVNTATGEVEGHEGRHRMLALAREGVTTAPVVLVDTATKYSKEPMAQMRLTSQDFGDGPVNGGYSVTVEDLIPTNKKYRDQIKETYGWEKAGVRFSLSSPVEETKTLVALHNLNETKMWKALALGGFPMPSIAVTRKDIPHTNFGPISLVMSRDTIDPKKSRKNTVYSADAWTPTFPSIEYEADSKAAKRLRDKYYKLAQEHGSEVARPLYSAGAVDAADEMNRWGGEAGLIEHYRDDPDMMKLYLVDTGKTVPANVTEEHVERIPDGTIAMYNHIAEALGRDTLDELLGHDGAKPKTRKAWWTEHGEAFDRAYSEHLATAPGITPEEATKMIAAEKPARKTILATGIAQYLRNGPEKRTTVINGPKTRDAIRKAAEGEGYNAWLQDLFGGLEKSSGIYNNKDIFTPSGNRRTFKQTHYPVTLENIVKAMAGQNDGNTRAVTGFHGIKTLRAGTARRFKSIKEMHDYEGRLKHLTPEEAEQINDALSARLSDIIQRIYEKGPHNSYDNYFIATDSIGETLMEVAESGNYSIDNIVKTFGRYQYKLGNELAQEIKELLFDTTQMPVNIFEAKPERAVRFDEVLAAVVPSDMDAGLRQRMEEAGMRLIDYEKDNEQSRIDAVNSVKGARFSISAQDDADYLAAVERGNMETAQRMVDEAAKAAGYTIKAYHGTPNGTFHVFRDWSYFTEDRDYADVYQNQGASSNGYKQTADNPKTYGVYLKPGDVFDTRTAKDRAIFQKEFYRQWGNGAPLSERGLPDWTDGDDLIEFFDEKGYGYDAFYLDEGGTGGYGDEVRDRGVSIVIKDSAQVKSSDPVTYDDDGNVIPLSERFNEGKEDIRYSLDNVIAFPQNGRGSGATVNEAMQDEKRVNELRQEVRDLADKLEFAEYDDSLSDAEIRRMRNRLFKAQSDLDKLIAKERSLSRKTSIADLLDDLDYYRRSDLESLAEQISDGAWDDIEDLSDDDLRDSLRDMLNEWKDGMSPLEAQAAKYGFYVRPPARYSLGGTEQMDAVTLMRENQLLRDQLEQWKSQVKPSDRTKVKPEEVKKLARRLAKDYATEMDTEEIAKTLQGIYDGMGRDLSYERAYEEAGNLARAMIEEASVMEDSLYRQYRDLREHFREKALIISPDMKADISADYGEWRKRHFGRMKLKAGDTTNVDWMFQEAAGKWPEFFNEEVTSDPAGQVLRIAEVLDSVYAVQELNPYAGDMDAAAGYLAAEIMESFWDMPNIAKTFADKAEEKLARQRERTEEEKQKRRDAVQEEREKGRAKLDRANLRADWLEAKGRHEERRKRETALAKLRKEHREKYDKAMEKAREDRDARLQAQKEKYLGQKRANSRKQKEREMRAKIMRHAKKLSTKLLRPTDNQHIPEELRNAVAAALDSINLSSKNGKPTKRTQAFSELQAAYRDVLENGGEIVVDPALIWQIDKIIGFRDTPIANLGLDDLNTVWDVVKAIEASVSTYNKMLGRAKFETISEPAFGIRDYLTGRKNRGDFRGPFRQMDRLLNFGMLTPEGYFLRLGESGKGVFKMIRDAQDQNITILKDAEAATREIIKPGRHRKLEKKKHTFNFDGQTVELTTAQIMNLYVLMGRQQAVDHIMVGGFRPDSVKKGIKDMAPPDAWHLTQDQVSEILDSLTPEEAKIADGLRQYIGTELTRLGNEASMEVYGYKKFREKSYWPIETDKNQVQSDVKNDAVSGTVAGWGSAKPLTPHANNAVILRSIFDVYADHVTGMAKYASWLATMENLNRIFNFRYKDEEGHMAGGVKTELERAFGKNGSGYWKNLMDDLNAGVKARSDNPFQALTGAYKASAIAGNIRVIVQQPTAILRALDMLNPADIAAGMALARPGKWDNTVKQYAPIAVWKDWGYFTADTGKQMRNVLFGDDNAVQRFNYFFMNNPVLSPGAADSVTWTAIWNAVEIETRRKRKDLRPKSEEYYQAVADRFNDVIDHTQVVDGIPQRSQIMRSTSDVTKMATSFMSEPTKSYNMMTSAIYEARNAQGAARGKAMAKLGRSTLALMASFAVNAAVQSIVDAVRDDDKDEEYWEKFLQAYFGEGGETRKDQVKSFFMEGNLGAAFNPATYIPFVKDILSIGQGYTVSRMDMDVISKVMKEVQNVQKAMNGEGKKTVRLAWINLAAEVSRFLGMPVANLKRDILAFSRTFYTQTGNYRMQYELEKFMYDETNPQNMGEFAKLILGAERAGDDEAAEYIRSSMISAGADGEKLDKKLAALRKTAVEDTEEFQTALAQRTDAYSTMLDASPQFQALTGEQQTKARGMVEDYAKWQAYGDQVALNENDQKSFEKMQAAEAEQIDPALYAICVTAFADMKNDKDENGDDIKGQHQQDKVIRYIRALPDLTDAQRSALYHLKYDSDKNNPWA